MKYKAEEIKTVEGLFPIQIVGISDEEQEGKYGQYLIVSFSIPGKAIGDEEDDVFFTRPMSARVQPNTNLGRLVQAVNGGEYPVGKDVDTDQLVDQWFEGMISQEFDEQFLQTKIHTYGPLSAKTKKTLGKGVLKETAPFSF